MNTLSHIKNANVPARVKTCMGREIQKSMLKYAIYQTFISGFLFDNEIKILKKKTFPSKFSDKKKQIMTSAFSEECGLFSLFKIIVLSFQDYYLIDRCVNFRGDFIFATSSYYWKNQTLVKHAMNSCHDAYNLLSYCGLTNDYQTRTNGSHNLKTYIFNVSVLSKSRHHKLLKFNLTHNDNKMIIDDGHYKKMKYSFYDTNAKRINECYKHYFMFNYYNVDYKFDNRVAHIIVDRKTDYERFTQQIYNYGMSQDEFFDRYYYDKREIIQKKYFFSHDETNLHSKQLKNAKEVDTKKWSTKNKTKKYGHIPNKNSKKSRKIIGTYKTA